LSAIAENPPKDIDELMFIMKETPTRVERYGVQILKVLGAKNAN
jgi:hypothetical protein